MTTVVLSADVQVVRLDLSQLAVDGKTHVDLSMDDIDWLTAALQAHAAATKAHGFREDSAQR